MSALVLSGIKKSFVRHGARFPVLDGVNLTIGDGEFVSLFGPNGSGKSTLIEIATGLTQADSGTVSKPGAQKADVIPVVFQDYRRSLLPWASVRDNILFPLRLVGAGPARCEQMLSELVAEFETDLDLDANVSTLSGGQAQMVCIMRALSISPRLLICDEPFSALDYGARLFLQERLMAIALRRRLAVMLVSHDLDEALLLGDRVVFLSSRPGQIIGEVTNPLPRPRSVLDISGETFGELRSQSLALFQEATGGRVGLG